MIEQSELDLIKLCASNGYAVGGNRIVDLVDDIAALKAENNTLRDLLVRVVKEGTDGCISSECTLEMLRNVPVEVNFVKAERDLLREKVQKMRLKLRDIIDASKSCCLAHGVVPKVAPLLHYALRSLNIVLEDARDIINDN